MRGWTLHYETKIRIEDFCYLFADSVKIIQKEHSSSLKMKKLLYVIIRPAVVVLIWIFVFLKYLFPNFQKRRNAILFTTLTVLAKNGETQEHVLHRMVKNETEIDISWKEFSCCLHYLCNKNNIQKRTECCTCERCEFSSSNFGFSTQINYYKITASGRRKKPTYSTNIPVAKPTGTLSPA